MRQQIEQMQLREKQLSKQVRELEDKLAEVRLMGLGLLGLLSQLRRGHCWPPVCSPWLSWEADVPQYGVFVSVVFFWAPSMCTASIPCCIHHAWPTPS